MSKSITTDRRPLWLPDNAVRVRLKTVDAELFAFTDTRGRPAAIAFKGKSTKPAWRYSFRTEQEREAYVIQWSEALKEAANRKAAERAEKAAWVHGFKVGDLLSYSWGYDQTNIDYFEVTAVYGRMVGIRPIGSKTTESTGSMSDYRIPVPGTYYGPEVRKLAQRPWNGEGPGILKMDHGIARLTSASERQHCTWYA